MLFHGRECHTVPLRGKAINYPLWVQAGREETFEYTETWPQARQLRKAQWERSLFCMWKMPGPAVSRWQVMEPS